jgi:hypothetical protein
MKTLHVLKLTLLVSFLSIGMAMTRTKFVREMQEGFGPIEGTIGVTLIEFSAFSYDQDDLEMEVSDV